MVDQRSDAMRLRTRIKTMLGASIPALHALQKFLYRFKPYKAKFRAYYLDGGWGKYESRSGPGSTLASTRKVRERLRGLLQDLQIRSVLDVPCGDFHWMQEVDLGTAEYIGIDIVHEIVAANTARYGRRGRRFQVGDLIKDSLPLADLVICRDCLPHYTLDLATKALANLRRSGSRYLLATTFPAIEENADLLTPGLFRRINLERPPFGLPRPLELIPEDMGGKALGLWRLDGGD